MSVARDSACEVVWYTRNQRRVTTVGIGQATAIAPIFSAGAYRPYRRNSTAIRVWHRSWNNSTPQPTSYTFVPCTQCAQAFCIFSDRPLGVLSRRVATYVLDVKHRTHQHLAHRLRANAARYGSYCPYRLNLFVLETIKLCKWTITLQLRHICRLPHIAWTKK